VAAIREILDLSRGRSLATPQKRETHMHDLLIAAAFVLMILLPCIVSANAGTAEE